MFKNSIISLFLVILVCISCVTDETSKTALEGTWVESYTFKLAENDDVNNDKVRKIQLFDFHDNKVRMKNFYPRTSDKYLDTIVSFTLKSDSIIQFGDNKIKQIKIAKDSIVFTMSEEGISKIVYRKLPEVVSKVDWNPIGREYKLALEDEYRYFDFVSEAKIDFLMNDSGRIYEMDWKLETINNQTIMIRKYLEDILITTVDSIQGDKVFMTDYYEGVKSYVYKQQKIAHTKPPLLFGEWKLVLESGKTIKKDRKRTLIGNNLRKMRIKEDSIHIIDTPYTSMFDSWSFYDNIKTITLDKNRKAIQIKKVTKDSLILQMNLSDYSSLNKEVVLIRE